ncbi:MAG: PQQ-binding-like beta-propeller repeat protein [Chthoniobacterales bacterium]|nr:PQQ-binding-like beta-propeller repeat protein [Chthoniobacterales bacterium]
MTIFLHLTATALLCSAPTLQARDRQSGEVLWSFETETSKQNKGWVLTKDRAFNDPLLYHSNWREAPLRALEQQLSVGGIYSSPLIVDGVVFFGSTDGYLYALE